MRELGHDLSAWRAEVAVAAAAPDRAVERQLQVVDVALSIASGRTSTLDIRVLAHGCIAAATKCACASRMRMIELPPWFVFGPYSRKRFGNPGTAMPWYARGTPAQWSWMLAALATDDVDAAEVLGGAEPGAQHDRVARVVPSRRPFGCRSGVTRSIRSVTSSTSSRCTAG